jgi:DNA-binding protein
MEKYVKEVKPPQLEAGVVNVGNITKIMLLADTCCADIEQTGRVVIRGMGAATAKVVSLAEVLKTRMQGLHQITETESETVSTTFLPTEEGLDKVVKTKVISKLTITLSREPLDTSHPGYQGP